MVKPTPFTGSVDGHCPRCGGAAVFAVTLTAVLIDDDYGATYLRPELRAPHIRHDCPKGEP